MVNIEDSEDSTKRPQRSRQTLDDSTIFIVSLAAGIGFVALGFIQSIQMLHLNQAYFSLPTACPLIYARSFRSRLLK